MKKIKFKKLLIPASLLVVVTLAACAKSFLDKPPLGTLNPQIMASPDGVQGLLIGAYSLVDGEGASGDGFASGASNWIWGGVGSDDANKGSDPSDVADAAPVEDWTITPVDGALEQKWVVCYAGAKRSNDVLTTLALAGSTIGARDAGYIRAQARFLRGFYHFELKKMFGKIPYIDENSNASNISNGTDIWPNIEADLQAAVDSLPDNWMDPLLVGPNRVGEVGRANSWAAKAMLAKTYVYEGKLDAAYPILQDIIAHGKTSHNDAYALSQHYYSNFNPAQKNGPESVFAAQTSVQDGSSVDWGGDPNGNYGDILNFPYTGGPGACCGFYNPTQDLADAYKTDAVTGLPLLDGSWKNGNHVSDPTTPYTGTLDPRIDWVMGRKGIPYLDWGPHPGDAWIRNPSADGHFSPKKDVYASSQKGTYTDVGSAYWGPTELTANNVNIIRFADVILWAAECAAGGSSTDLVAATNYVNMIRQRAADKTGWVSSTASTYDAANAIYTDASSHPADNYKIGLYAIFPDKATAISAIQFERRLELAMEGHRFFDLVRWGIADNVLNDYYNRYRNIMPLKKNAKWTPNKNEVYPIPQIEIDNMNSDGKTRLTQNTGY